MQRGLFDDCEDGSQPIEFCDHRMDDDHKPRLTRQCRLILERLRSGPVTNQELATIALKYTGRISDLRKSGYDVRMISQNHKTGRSTYALFIRGQMVNGEA